jgi:hypothetical protein
VNRRGKSVSRVLYWFRTPPDVRVGRQPFDEAVRRALEARYPDVRFDWRQILETPIPSADAEKWRERRRAERSERAARQASEREDDEASGAEEQRPSDAPMHVLEAVASAAVTSVEVLTTIEPSESPAAVEPPSGASVDPPRHVVAPARGTRRKRRRRRGGHGRPGSAPAREGSKDERLAHDGPAEPGDTTAPVVPGEPHATHKDE